MRSEDIHILLTTPTTFRRYYMRQEFIKDPTPTENLEIKLEIELEEVAERLELGARWENGHRSP